MEKAFAAGYDPALELAKLDILRESGSNGQTLGGDFSDFGQYLRRKEQDAVDLIMHGEESGHYFMLLGPKVSSRSFMSILACNIKEWFSHFRVLAKVQ